MNVRVIKYADGVAENKVASLGVTGLSLPADTMKIISWTRPCLSRLDTSWLKCG